MSRRYIFSSESVTEGHPDKVCDTISDYILDACLEGDEHSRVACETLVKGNLVVMAGEITTLAQFDYLAKAREAIRDIGYIYSDCSFHADTCQIMCALGPQSEHIKQGVDAARAEGKGTDEQGAGDQGLMFGFAVRETEELMPAPIEYAHKLGRKLTQLRKSAELADDGSRKFEWLRPDAKTQVSIEYEGYRPLRIDTIVISTHHSAKITQGAIRELLEDRVIRTVIPAELLDNTTILINPTGSFLTGGPEADSGLTGRKIIVDSYGGMGRHGGGAFSGKDPSKVDRSAAYMGRYVAKNVVASGVADRCEVQFAYAIGHPDPVSIHVETFGTAKVEEARIEQAIREIFNFKPAQIIKHLKLLRPIYSKTTNYGHFGRTDDLDALTWEKTDKADEIRTALT